MSHNEEILQVIRCDMDTLLHNKLVIYDVNGSTKSRYQIIEIPSGAIGVGWCDSERNGLIIAVARECDYEMRNEIEYDRGGSLRRESQ